jgi:predicted Fe-Mo cluster-binding NifX family protein
MRVAIATEGNQVAAHFGRCPQYTLVDLVDTGETARTVVNNPGHEPGRIPAFLHEHKAEVIVAGGMGGRAQDLFAQMGIRQIVGVQGSIDLAVAGCIDGTLTGGESLCSHPDGGHGDGHGGDHECGHEGHAE